MVKNNFTTLISISIIFFFSLIPFLWVQDGMMILGHDAGTPISPTVHFLDRLSTWTHRYSLGADQTFAVPGFFIHGFEYVLDRIGFTVSLAQGVEFAAYMLGSGLAMFYLAKTVFPDKKYLPLFAALIYEFNHFTLQAWYIAERTKFTTYIALPILLAVIYKLSKNSISTVRAALVISLTFTVLNGGGFLPLFGSVFVTSGVWIVVILVSNQSKQLFLKKIIIFMVLTMGLWILFNLYWLLPYILYLRTSFTTVSEGSGGIEGVIGWLTSISQWASFTNLFRLQGIPEWYGNPNHPYAKVFFSNIWFKIIAGLLPIFAFTPLIIARNKKRIAFIVLVGLVNMFFVAGSHPPFGWLYILFIKYIPGFLAFRTAYYKFAPGLWLAYGLLIGYTFDFVLSKISRRYLGLLGSLLISLGIVGYSFPFITKSLFQYDVNRTTLVKVPDYIEKYGSDRGNNKLPFNRILMLPPQPEIRTAEHTDWNYWSLAQTTSLLDDGSYVDRSVSLNASESAIINELYRKLNSGDSEWIGIAERIGIDAMIVRDDFIPYVSDGMQIDGNFYRERLDEFGFNKHMDYGKWQIYPFGQKTSDVTFHNKYAVVRDLRKELLFPSFGFDFSHAIDSSTVITDEQITGADNLQVAEIVIPNCEKCSLPAPMIFDEKPNPIIFPGSIFYKLKLFYENISMPKIDSPDESLRFLTRKGLRKMFEMKRAIEHKVPKEDRVDAWLRYADIIDMIDHEVRANYSNKSIEQSQNELLISIEENLNIQIRELNSLSYIVSDSIEGGPFIRLYESMQRLRNEINRITFRSNSVYEKKFSIPVTVGGVYSFWLDPLSYGEDVEQEKHGRTFIAELDGEKIEKVISSNSDWAEIFSMNLTKGLHKLIVYDPARNLAEGIISANSIGDSLMSHESFTLTYPDATDCREINLGRLPHDNYQVKFNVRSENFKSKISVFVENEGINQIKLPSLTETLTLIETGSANYKSTFISNGNNESIISLCQLFTEQKDDILVSGLSVVRVSSPRIVLVRKNDGFSSVEIPDQVVIKKDNTDYKIELKPHQGSIVMLNQRYDPGWSPTNNHFRANIYAQAWFLSSSPEPTELNITFQNQKAFYDGVKISLLGLAGVLIFSILKLIKSRLKI